MTTRFKPEVSWSEAFQCFKAAVFDVEADGNVAMRGDGTRFVHCDDPQVAWQLATERAAQLELSHAPQFVTEPPADERAETLREIADCIEEAQTIMLRLKLLTSEVQ